MSCAAMMTLFAWTLIGCASSKSYDNPGITPPLPQSVENGGWVVQLPKDKNLGPAETKELMTKIRANELRQARAVRAAKEYHKQLVKQSNGK